MPTTLTPHQSRGARFATSAAPVVVDLPGHFSAAQAFERIADLPHAVFFDSARRDDELGRYSYVAADPFDWIERGADDRPLDAWRRRNAQWSSEHVAGLPPWQGGCAGVLGYELGHALERIPAARLDEFRTPALALGWYDWVLAFDHHDGCGWLISHGLPEQGEARRRRAELRAAWVLDRLDRPRSVADRPNKVAPAIARDELAPQFETPAGPGVWSDFSRDGYLRAVERVIAHLRAGDAFQVNLSQRLLLPARHDPVTAYLRLRQQNPAPFGAFLNGDRWTIASASPERFLSVRDRVVETRPIKGTCPRGATPAEDAALADALLASEKDRAENVMIVDLLRNDLARVAEDDSVAVPDLFRLERYEHVQHLVSVVTAKLRDGIDIVDMIAATFPGGSISGAPKVRAQQIIAEQEPTARGLYCGAMLWATFPDDQRRQSMDSSILIRTLTQAAGWVQAPVGGGITVRSDPAREYEETWHKAAGLIDAVAR